MPVLERYAKPHHVLSMRGTCAGCGETFYYDPFTDNAVTGPFVGVAHNFTCARNAHAKQTIAKLAKEMNHENLA